MSENHTDTVAEANCCPHACLTVEAIGVTMLLPEQNRVVLANGTPRVSRNDSQIIIPRHYPIIALPPGSYEEDPKLPPRMSFHYNLDNANENRPFDAFDITGCDVAIEHVAAAKPQLDTNTITRMEDLVTGLKLKEGVVDGSDPSVAALIDLFNATSIKGTEHAGHFKGVVRFGSTVIKPAEKIIAQFDVSHGTPSIRLTGKKETRYIRLKGTCPWTVMIANVPFEELANVNMFAEGQNVPLAHFELLYDFFEMTPSGARPVPTFDGTVRHMAPPAGTQPPLAGHDTAGMPSLTMGTGGLCGPPTQWP